MGLLVQATAPGLGREVATLAAASYLGHRVAPLGPAPRSLALSSAAPDLGCGVTPLGCCPSGMGSSRLLPLTSDVGQLLSAVLSALVAAT